MARYRQALALSFFLKFFLEVSKKLNEVPVEQPYHDPVGRPVPHASAQKHATGEAIYCNDIQVANCLHMAFVMSPIASGRLQSVDTSAALAMSGVVTYIDARDVVKGAKIGFSSDTPIFVEDEISYHGQPIGAVVAVDHDTARRAANAVKVKCTKNEPILTIEDAIEANSYLGELMSIHSSLLDNDAVTKHDWSKYKHVVEGEIKIGGQEHFYLETQQCVVVPHEDDELEVHVSTQGASSLQIGGQEHFYLETQQCVVVPHEDDELEVHVSTQGASSLQMELAKCLKIPAHKIVVKVKRIGGGFGGKENTAALFGVPTAIAARKQPVRLTMERFDDMAMSGTRHPFRFNYKVNLSVALDSSGKFLDYDVVAYSNCGYSFDLSVGITQRAMLHLDNVYKFPNADIYGRLCRTNLASNTAFRGFGGPQGMFCTETLIKHIAEEMDMDPDKIREINFYKENECTPFGMPLRRNNIARTWYECKECSDYERRKTQVVEYNRDNKYRKRGIYMTPTRFAIGYQVKHLCQGGALVMIYSDGSVLVSHGGMEMGQGLHTKMLQVAARCLDIPIEKVHIFDTSSDKVPNASPTSASSGSDINGLAVQDACRQLLQRLDPFRKANPRGTWEEWVEQAYMERVPLSATGFATIHFEPIDFRSGKGAAMFGYCVYGAACCEVEVDCLTGDHYLLRTDIVMDVGDSLNPAIDIGQIEGAFLQGYGLFTMEEIKIRPDGVRLTRGPSTYKIPAADDAPRHMNVRLLKGSSNPLGIFSSKAVGEPPLFLGSCAFFAIREAVRSYRMDHGLVGYFRFDAPATPERIRLACEDEVLGKVPPTPQKGTFSPWTVNL
ncbi:putative xanthine dehydrogenase, molybdopterin binding subunit [Oesophagostomum dentatum]|uniref:Putative xanthine dehydrogenase, molybdopterin binding subunit n=1 Tax=Oesophagostomum dentatum TaxID=61180 RepID=A0A0B1TQP6_OESDE|nr:putative xanthine dehydrogenase, molybdopterin binding subunit [Oesophagostomum dentatum]